MCRAWHPWWCQYRRRAAGMEGSNGHLVRVGLDGHAEGAAEPQVSDFEAVHRVVNQQVLRLEVAVHHAVLVAVRDALHQLVHEALRTGRGGTQHQVRPAWDPSPHQPTKSWPSWGNEQEPCMRWRSAPADTTRPAGTLSTSDLPEWSTKSSMVRMPRPLTCSAASPPATRTAL